MMNISDCREKSKLSIGYMADALGISSEEYVRYEKYPSITPINIALGISRITGIPYDDIFFNDHSN